jgi:hypothetical protein
MGIVDAVQAAATEMASTCAHAPSSDTEGDLGAWTESQQVPQGGQLALPKLRSTGD